MSVYVRKVQFKLHESYPNPVRSTSHPVFVLWFYVVMINVHSINCEPTVLTKPPYEINETGWGEFEVVIKIYFMDSSEKPVSSTISLVAPVECKVMYV